MPTSLKAKLVFFGNERLATGLSTTAPVLRALINAGYEIKAVITSYSPTVSRSTRQLEIVEVAKAHKIEVLMPDNLNDITKKLSNMKADVGILVAYGQLVPQKIIDIFPSGIINIHPSLLPMNRGSTPIETAILNAPKQTGVSLMALISEMDAGPVYAQAKFNLYGDETKAELADILIKLGIDLLIDNLDSILSGAKLPIAQNPDKQTKNNDKLSLSYTKRINKADGMVDFGSSAAYIERQVRAYAGWPKSRAKVFNQDIIILKARVAKTETDGELVIKCLPGWLEITELIGPSGRIMSGADFRRGYIK